MKKTFMLLALVCLIAMPAFAQSSYEIVRADYGSGNNWVDVTEQVRALVQNDTLNIRVGAAVLGASPRRARNRSLRLQLRDENGATRQVTYRDNQRVRLLVNDSDPRGLHITRATYAYGTRALDVTARLNDQIRGEQLNIQVNNQNMGGDPAPGEEKTLTVNYTMDGESGQRVVREGDSLHLTHGNTHQGTLHIDRATYGSTYRNADVTTRLSSQINGNQLHLPVNSTTMGGDPAPGQAKRLTVQYSVNGQRNEIVVNDGDTLRLNSSNFPNSQQGNLQIDRATYGSGYRTTDVTSRLSSQIRGGQLNLPVNSNSMGSDPAPGQPKSVTVRYTVNGQSNTVMVNDGEMLRLNSGTDQGNSQSALQINRATYGSGYRSSDVTARLNSQVRNNQLNLQVTDANMGGDPAPNQAKSLTVQYSVNGRTDQVVVNEGDMLRLNNGSDQGNSQSALQINRATYGSGYRSSDVTARLNSQVRNNQLNLQVTDANMGGDPAPNQAKSLTVQYSVNGRTDQVVVNEGDMLRLSSATSTTGLARRFNCESVQANGYGRTNCAANRGNEVRFVRQIGETQCTQNRTWGYDANGVWVDQGCRAEFEVLGRARVIASNSSSDITGSTTLMNGTELSIRTNELIDSSNANVGQTFSATVASDVLNSSGEVIVPRGAEARLVIRSTEAGGVTGTSELVLDVDSLTVNGTKYTISTGDVAQQGGEGVGSNKKTAVLVGGGAALGTLIGAIVGGGKGAAIGAAIGAGGGLGATVLTRGKQVRVPAETLLNFRLDKDLRLQAGR
ncbi:MAG: DUF3395 domain-containing protein [Terriglobales bacterium]